MNIETVMDIGEISSYSQSKFYHKNFQAEMME